MRIGIPKETKTLEGRVGLVPEAAGELVRQGHEVFVETGAGQGSGFGDEDFARHGVRIADDAPQLYDAAELIVKVKEPQPEELQWLRRDHVLFSYLHLAASPSLLTGLLDIGLTAVAFETVEEADGSLPLLAPMSDIAGRIAVQVGTHLLHRPAGGKGLLLGGLPAAPRGHVVIIGAGVAGSNAAAVAAGLGARVTVFDRKREKLAAIRRLGPNVSGLYPYSSALTAAVADADLVIGAVLLIGERAPHVVTAAMVRSMEPGSVVVDISVDQGGCIETTRPTDYGSPTFQWEGVTHFCVTNMPGAVPKSASEALSASILPYVSALTRADWVQQPNLAKGVNVRDGRIVHPGLQRSVSP